MAKNSFSCPDNLIVSLTKYLKKYSFAIIIVALTILEKSAVPCTLFFLIKSQKQDYQQQISLIQKQSDHNLEQISQSTQQSQIYQKSIDSLQQEVENNHRKSEKTEALVKQSQRVNNLIRGKVDRSNHQQKKNSITLNQQQKQIDSLLKKISELEVNINEKKSDKNPLSIVERIPQKPNITAHICIDGNNLYKSSQEIGLSIDWQRLAIFLAQTAGNVDRIQMKYYTGIPQNISRGQQQKLKRLQKLNYEIIGLPIAQRDNGEDKTQGDDVKLSIDSIIEARAGDRVVLVSGDGDFIPLVEKLLAQNIKVTVIGGLNNTSGQWLTQFNDDPHFKLISLEAIADKIVRLTKLAS